MLSDQVSDFLSDKRRKSPATQEQYRFVLERVFLPWAASHKIAEAAQVTDKVLNRFTDHLEARLTPKGQPPSAATLQTYIRSVRIFLKWADVPRGRYEPPTRPKRLRDVLSRDEIDRMEKAAGDERDRLVVRVLADTGVRVSELLGLRQVDLRHDKHERQHFIRVDGKTGPRDVPIPGPVFERLATFAQFVEPTGRIFQSKRLRGGGRMRLTRSGVGQMVRHLGEVAHIPKRVYPHLFRHSYATYMVKREVGLATIQKALGHSTLAMLTEVYNQSTSADGYDALTKALKGG